MSTPPIDRRRPLHQDTVPLVDDVLVPARPSVASRFWSSVRVIRRHLPSLPLSWARARAPVDGPVAALLTPSEAPPGDSAYGSLAPSAPATRRRTPRARSVSEAAGTAPDLAVATRITRWADTLSQCGGSQEGCKMRWARDILVTNLKILARRSGPLPTGMARLNAETGRGPLADLVMVFEVFTEELQRARDGILGAATCPTFATDQERYVWLDERLTKPPTWWFQLTEESTGERQTRKRAEWGTALDLVRVNLNAFQTGVLADQPRSAFSA